MGLPNLSPETKLSAANADRETILFPVQLTTCRIGNLTRLIHILPIYVTIHPHIQPQCVAASPEYCLPPGHFPV